MRNFTKKVCVFMVLGAAVCLVAGDVEDSEESRSFSVRKILYPIDKETNSGVDNFKKMCTNAKVSAQFKTMYADYNYKQEGTPKSYATALGADMKYELAEFQGFNAAIAFSTSQDVRVATGDSDTGGQNSELSSSSGSYTEATQAYINYKYNALNLRGGRQVIDTPLADSDDIRMIHNTFEAYIAIYEIDGFEFTAGNLQRWQGVDTGLDDGWINAGENGTWLAGVTYGNDVVSFNAWYYNISKFINALYVDADAQITINEDITFHGGVQYLNESELDNSGVEASIYGAVVELSGYGLRVGATYNKSDRKTAKESFSGFGGGTLYTNMDTMILDAIAQDREVSVFVSGISYTLNNFNFLYAYGDFQGGKDSSNTQAHIEEQDLGIEYAFNDELLMSAYYIIEEDKQSDVKTTNDWDRVQISLIYSF